MDFKAATAWTILSMESFKALVNDNGFCDVSD